MSTHKSLAIAAIAATVLLGAWRATPVNAPHTSNNTAPAVSPDACALLSDAEISAALEVTTQPGKPVVASSPLGCVWSSDAGSVPSGRRVTIAYSSLAAFNNAKSHPNTLFSVEPTGGAGDDAFYEVFKSDSPYLVVKKGSTVFTVRILNGLKYKAFTPDQVKAKELVLGRAASGRV